MVYKTKQSESIERLLRENRGRHLTAEELYRLLQEAGESVGQTTVYRHLDKLCAQGTVRKFLGGDGGACYQLAGSDESCRTHYHLKCTACGKLFHAQCNFLNALSEHIRKEHGFSVDGSKTVLYGLCDTCAKKEGKDHDAHA